ncbi:MAG: hypothetical protein ACD_39C02121G0004 [uncultured bacterium]|nr:MAG: hypothetical protein ACD_39C02121G0004 [uncultured bacterium]
MSIITCEACKKEYEQASVCPHCGTATPGKPFYKSLAKLSLYFAGFCVLVFILGSGSKTERTATDQKPAEIKAELPKNAVETNKVEENPVNWKYKADEISRYLASNSSKTEIQREKFLKDITGERICWTGVVENVQKHWSGYKIQLKATPYSLGAAVYVKDKSNASFIEGLSANTYVSAIGIFEVSLLGEIEINNATIHTKDEASRIRENEKFNARIGTFNNDKIELVFNSSNFHKYDQLEGKMVVIPLTDLMPYESELTPPNAKAFKGNFNCGTTIEVILEVPIKHAAEFESAVDGSVMAQGYLYLLGKLLFELSPCKLYQAN